MNRRLLLFPAFLAGCTVQTTGGYFYSRGSSPALAGYHAAVAEALVPTIDDNPCLDAEGERVRRLAVTGQIVEENAVEVSEKSQHELIVEHRCPGSAPELQTASPPHSGRQRRRTSQ